MTAIASLTYGEADPPAAVEAAAAGSFAALGLRFIAPRTGLLRVPDGATLRETAARLAATGLSVLEIEAAWLTPETRVDAFLPALDAGARLGARFLVVSVDDPDAARAKDRLAALTAAAAALGLRALLEFLPYTSIATLQQASALAAAAGSGLVVDALHLARSGGSPAEVGALPTGLVGLAQLCDAPAHAPPRDQLRAEAIGGRRLPGEGDLPLRALLAVLPPGTPLSLEVPRAADAHLPARERASRAGAAFRDWLSGVTTA